MREKLEHVLIPVGVFTLILVAVFGYYVYTSFSGVPTPSDNQTTPSLNASGWTEEGVSSLANATNRFAFDLYLKYKDDYQGENVFFSPYSISTAMSMTYEGAKGNTAEEIREVFYLPEDSEVRRPAFARTINQLNPESEEYQLNTANALWVHDGYPLREEYLGIIKDYYGGNATNLDFVGAAEQSRQTINQWVEEQTQDKIKDLISPGALNSMTRLVLTNAIYFKGTWVTEFDETLTQEETFYAPSGEVMTPMMRLSEASDFNYTETQDLQVLEMPYKGKNISMLVLLPRQKNGLSGLEEELSLEKLAEWKDQLGEEEVMVHMPKFEFETKYSMVGDLQEMGVEKAFIPGQADFSGMDGTQELFIHDVIHKAYIKVDEEGTEAAAATAVIVGTTSISTTPTFRADHPFIFLIQEKDTGQILFMGRVTDPTQ